LIAPRYLNPQQGLADGVVADDLFDRGVGIEFAPKGEVLGLIERQAGEQQAGLADRPSLSYITSGGSGLFLSRRKG
jgi:hypothetical protein